MTHANPTIRRLAWLQCASTLLLVALSLFWGTTPTVARLPREWMPVAYAPVLCIATCVPVMLLMWIARAPADVTVADERLIARTGLVSVVLACAATPIAGDAWNYLLNGRQFISGANPYYQLISDAEVEAVHLPSRVALMTYGPVWAWLSAALVWLSAGSATVQYLLLKLVALSSWLVMVRSTAEVIRERSCAVRARASVLLGWLPTVVFFGLAEAHNDMLVAAGVALWMRGRVRTSVWSGIPLAVVTFVKYSTGPLVGLAIVDACLRRRWREAGITLLAALGSALTVLPFWQGPGYFDGLRRLAGYPAMFSVSAAVHAVIVGGARLGEGAHLAVLWSVRLVIIGAVVPATRRAMASPQFDRIVALAAVMTTALILMWSVVLPYYFIWLLPLVVVAPKTWVWPAVLAPMLWCGLFQVLWFVGPLSRFLSYASVVAYGSGLLVLIATRWSSRRDEAQA